MKMMTFHETPDKATCDSLLEMPLLRVEAKTVSFCCSHY